MVGFTDKPAHNLYPVPLPSVEADVLAKVDLVQRADKAARAYDPRIHEVRVGYADELRRILVIGSDGSFAEDSQPLSRMSVFCIAKIESRARRAALPAAADAWRWTTSRAKTPEHFAKEAARQAIIQLDAREAPAGEMEVVLGPGWPGILLHEAIGHGLEADFNRKKTSAFSGHARAAAWPATSVRWWTTAPCRAGAARSMSTTRAIATAEHRADRERHPEGLSVRQAFVAADGHSPIPATDAARVISTSPCRA